MSGALAPIPGQPQPPDPAPRAPRPTDRAGRAAPDVVVMGEAMALFVAQQTGPLEAVASFDKRTAGAETNVATGLARLGLHVGWISRLGDDSMGRYLRQALAGEGIDCSHVQMVAVAQGGRTGFMFKGRVDDGSDPPIEYHRQGSAASQLTADALDLAWIGSARHGHVTGIFPALNAGTLGATRAMMAALRAAGRTISFDPNLRPALWPSAQAMRDGIHALAAAAHWVLPGLEEGRQLTGETTPEGVAHFYRRLGARRVVVKLGPEGAWYDDEQAGCGYVPAHPVKQVVDTVGAGDGFAAGLISASLQGLPLPDAVRRATWIGARVVQCRGDTEGLPTADEARAAGY